MIAITGATGHLGRLIVDELLHKTNAGDLVAVVRNPDKATDLVEKGIAMRQADYEETEALVKAFKGIDVLMFISNMDFARREQQHKNVVDAATESEVGRIVYTSFIQTGGDDMLTRSHGNTEAHIKASGLPYTFLRDNFYMDAYTVEVEIAIKNGIYRTPTDTLAGAAMVTREDIARTAAVVLTQEGHAGKAYDMTGPSVVSPAAIAAAASTLSGNPVTHQQISWEELADDYKKRGMPAEYIQLSVMLERMISTNVLAGVSDDIARITGKPATDFLSFVKGQIIELSED